MTAELPEEHAHIVALLWQLRNTDGGWPYYRGRQSRLESTCWALLGTGAGVDTTPLPYWIGADGLLVEPATGQVNYAFNALAALTGGADRDTPHAMTRRIVGGLVE